MARRQEHSDQLTRPRATTRAQSDGDSRESPSPSHRWLHSAMIFGIGGCVLSSASGWYPDPDVPGQLRYFDGSAWTTHTAPVKQPLPQSPKRRARWPLIWLGIGTGAVLILGLILALAAFFGSQVTSGITTCEEAEQDAIRISAENLGGSGAPLLVAVQGLRVIQDLQPVSDLPSSGYAPVLTCTGVGTWSDGSEAPVDLLVTVDARGRYFVEYRPR